MKKAEYDSVESYVNIGDGFSHKLFASMANYLDLDSRKHFLALTSLKGRGFFCLIHLHDMFSIGVTLSNRTYLDKGMMFGVNDIDRKKFRKVSLQQLVTEIYAPPESRFQYYFPNKREMEEFLMLEKRKSLDFTQIMKAIHRYSGFFD